MDGSAVGDLNLSSHGQVDAAAQDAGQSFGHHVNRNNEGGERQAGTKHRGRGYENQTAIFTDQEAPFWRRWLNAEAKKSERGDKGRRIAGSKRKFDEKC